MTFYTTKWHHHNQMPLFIIDWYQLSMNAVTMVIVRDHVLLCELVLIFVICCCGVTNSCCAVEYDTSIKTLQNLSSPAGSLRHIWMNQDRFKRWINIFQDQSGPSRTRNLQNPSVPYRIHQAQKDKL